mgnify:CR=1 FL=1
MNKNKKGIDLVHVLVIETTGAHAVSKGKRNTENGIVLNVPFWISIFVTDANAAMKPSQSQHAYKDRKV